MKKSFFNKAKSLFQTPKQPSRPGQSAAAFSKGKKSASHVLLEEGVLKSWEEPAGKIRIPETCTAIGERAFCGARFLAGATLPEKLVSIGDFAFFDCRHLEKIELPASLQRIGSRAFSGCEALSELKLPKGLSSLGGSAFSGCRSLREMEIPSGVEQLPENLFYRCDSLFRVKLPKNLKSIDPTAFSKCFALFVVEDRNYLLHPEVYDGTPYGRLARRFTELYPGCPVPSVFPREVLGDLRGEYSGAFLRASGFSFFKEDRSYCFSAPDENGVVEVSSYAGEEDADEDGFGSEICYDYWLMDRENYRPIPGVKVFYGYSRLDMRNAAAQWAENRQKAAAILKKQRNEEN